MNEVNIGIQKSNADFSAHVFSGPELAESWIKENSLTGVLTKYPLDQGI
ncbi:hypothetical protein N473_21225 [Pseudoalteromonas luteoviolacea CPMOR-1]|uniref:DUF7710 domain-containing protein n=1 Tax=Pseudoalteromonas luteoviolacea CPMOR-1 TaxID=1365248 RepID=A0A167K383_9GAMM|nr:hypothetical protein [Pseudoalteromonas luteoviolacea]KZN62069.1 hypothetical protein N473_21225 [Pseudoalteromonas luteoviolacea CPMOR-1]